MTCTCSHLDNIISSHKQKKSTTMIQDCVFVLFRVFLLFIALLVTDSEATLAKNRWTDLQRIKTEENFFSDVKSRFDTLEASNLALRREAIELRNYLSRLRQVHAGLVDRDSFFDLAENERVLGELYATVKYVNNIKRGFVAQASSMQSRLNQSNIELTQLEDEVVNLEVILIPPFTHAPTESPTKLPLSQSPSTWAPTNIPAPQPSTSNPATPAPSSSIPPTASPGKIHLLRGYPKISFHNASGDEELIFKYKVPPSGGDSFYTAIVYQNDCKNVGDDSVIAKTHALEGNDGFVTVVVDVDLGTVSQSAFWSRTSSSTALLRFCLRLDYYMFEESINFSETNVTIQTDLRAGFDLTAVNITSSGRERQRNSTAAFAPNAVHAFDCADKSTQKMGNEPIVKGQELQLCVASDPAVASDLIVKDIYSLGLSQDYEGGTHYASIIAGYQPDTGTTKQCEQGMCSIHSQLASKWFEGDEPKDIVATMEVLMTSRNGTGNQLQTLVVNRTLAPAPPPVEDMHILWILIYVIVGVVGILITGGFAAYFIRKRTKGWRLIVMASTGGVDPARHNSLSSISQTLSQDGSNEIAVPQKSPREHGPLAEGRRRDCEEETGESSSSHSGNRKSLVVALDRELGDKSQKAPKLTDDDKAKATRRLSLPEQPSKRQSTSQARSSVRRSSLDSELCRTSETADQKLRTIKELAKKIESSRIQAAGASVSKISKTCQENRCANGSSKSKIEKCATAPPSDNCSRPISKEDSESPVEVPVTGESTGMLKLSPANDHGGNDTESPREQKESFNQPVLSPKEECIVGEVGTSAKIHSSKKAKRKGTKKKRMRDRNEVTERGEAPSSIEENQDLDALPKESSTNEAMRVKPPE